ncbi:MAG UNVERIFIED_CONTAM: hypothetical protein LVT10_11365 [Anaerolineae bacterium]
MAWTFDPLLSRNAYLNLRKLGAQANLFKQDAYGGYTSGGLSEFWHVRSALPQLVLGCGRGSSTRQRTPSPP